jgi:flagellar basal body-associated protein FliL
MQSCCFIKYTDGKTRQTESTRNKKQPQIKQRKAAGSGEIVREKSNQVNKMKNRLIQAYKQAPWRVQLQWIGLFLLFVVLISAITGVYLSVNSQAAAAGREIQSLESRIGAMNDDIAELTADLAEARSLENYFARAEELGFDLLDPAEAVYLEVPGYDPDRTMALASSRVNLITEAPIVRSSYRSSLWDWFVEKIWRVSGGSAASSGEEMP